MPPAKTSVTTARLLRMATYASSGTAILLIGVKTVAWLKTGSLSVMASMVDSLMDAAASLLNLVAVRYSLKSADADHQFGHGKAESLAGLAQASFIAGSAIFLLIHAAERLNNPRPLTDINIGIGIMLFAIVATMVLLGVQGYVIKRTNSTAIRADALHYKTDLLTNISTMATLFFVASGWPILDPLCATGISIYILYSAWHIGHEAMQTLMDHELPNTTRKAICNIGLSHESVLGIHDLRTRQSGQAMVIQLHLDLDEKLPLAEAHLVAKEVEAKIIEIFPTADVIIHQDPIAPELYYQKPKN